MDQNVQIKLEWENSLRRASVSRTETLAGVKRVVAALLELDVNKGPLDLTYKDEEGDTITVGSDLELRQLLDDAFATKKSLRFTVVAAPFEKKSSAAAADVDDIYEQEEEQEPEQPDFPFANVARALSDRQTVERVLLTLQSEAVVSAVTSFASTYAETQGNQALAGMAVLPQVPALLGVVTELVNEVPVLKDVQELVMPLVMAQCWGTSAPPMAQACGNEDAEHRHCPPHGRHGHCPRRHGHCRPHHGGHHGHPAPPHGHCRPHPHGGHHDHPHHDGGHHGGAQEHGGFRFAQVHFGVLCDGCASDDALKQQALREGHMTHRGFIRGTRYKSHSIQDFDLCESCHTNEQRFPGAVYGPFTSMAPPERPKCWGWQGRGAGRGGHGGPWRRGCGNGKTEPEVPAAEAASEPQTWEGLMGAFRQAVSQGAEAFSQAATAAKGEGGELAEIARAIAESLKETQPGKPAAAATANTAEQEKPVVEAKPVVEEAKSAAPDPFAKWAQQLRQLETLGFDKSETYIGFLEEENGDLEHVVNRIVRRDM